MLVWIVGFTGQPQTLAAADLLMDRGDLVHTLRRFAPAAIFDRQIRKLNGLPA